MNTIEDLREWLEKQVDFYAKAKENLNIDYCDGKEDGLLETLQKIEELRHKYGDS